MKKIMVVDNDRIMLRLMSRLLENEGYQVMTAKDSLSALDILKTYTPDVMFVDLIMPNIDGAMLCRVVRGNEKFKDVYLIIFSAISAEESIDIAKLGANACIAKGPFDEMAHHVLVTLEQPELTAEQCSLGEILGVQSVYPRGITQELLSIKNHFELVLERMSEGILEINSEGRIVYANPAALLLIDIPGKDLLGSNFVDLFFGDAHQRVCDLLTIKGDKPKRITEDAPVLLNGFQVALNILSLDDDASRSIIILNDVSERKRAEEELKSAREYAQNIIDSSIDMIISVDNDRKIVEFNRAAEVTFGYRKEEVRGKEVSILYADPEEGVQIREKANGIEQFVGEITNKRKDGSTFSTLLSFGLMQNKAGEGIGAVGVSRDITEQKRTQEALRESEEKYRTVLEASPDPIVVYDMDGKVIYFNPSFTHVFGWTLEERLGKKMDVFVPEEAWPETKMMINKVIAGESFSGIETLRYTKEGNIIPVNISGAIYRGDDGNPMGSVINLRDISEQKSLEARLQRAQKMEVVGTLAGGVAHDLNNVLSGIVSYPDLLLTEIPEDSPLRNRVLTMQASGKKAADIVQDLLTLARRGVSSTTVLNLNDIISEYLKSPEYKKLKSHHPSVEIETDLSSDLLNISGSPVHLSKTVMNLVSNAAEAMPDGGKIFISTGNRYIDRPFSGYDSVVEGDYITLRVSDTGIGISSEDKERIFEPFYTKKVMGRSGTGIGMAVVWGTVKDHRGYIDVQSIEGKGTTFMLYFPITRREVTKEKALLSFESYMGKGESILVIDDVKEQRGIASDMLTKLGYIVTSVSSGEEAVEYLKERIVDLIVLDMIMDPGIDGLDTYKQIIEMHPGQKAIIASGFSETDRVKEVQRLGAGKYIKKPYTLEKIGFAVKTELER